MKPEWLKVRLPVGDKFRNIQTVLKELELNTVCFEAICPNRGECFNNGHLTFMVLGNICTRRCKFCAVDTGNPKGSVDFEEPKRIAEAVKRLNLNYVIITSVTRDDLLDGGAKIFVETIKEIRAINPNIKIEVLSPDFSGSLTALKKVIDAEPDIFAHNLETIERLTTRVRDPRADYYRSLGILKKAKEFDSEIITKSGIMLGLGETEDEVVNTMIDLRDAKVDILTIGQYLKPAKGELEVKEFITPEKFKEYELRAKKLGFRYVTSGPLVRSSYTFQNRRDRKVIKDIFLSLVSLLSRLL